MVVILGSCVMCLLCSGPVLGFVCFKETAVALLSSNVKPLITVEAPMGIKGRQSSSTFTVLACLAYSMSSFSIPNWFSPAVLDAMQALESSPSHLKY